jgi:hypothetical protein
MRIRGVGLALRPGEARTVKAARMAAINIRTRGWKPRGGDQS